MSLSSEEGPGGGGHCRIKNGAYARPFRVAFWRKNFHKGIYFSQNDFQKGITNLKFPIHIGIFGEES